MENFKIVIDDILTANDFVKYCQKRWLDIDIKILEYFHKEKLLFPIFRLFPWIDENLRYLPFFISNDNDFLNYQNIGNIDFPINDKEFIEWKEYQALKPWYLDKEIYENHRVLFYSKKQIYIIKDLLLNRYSQKNIIYLWLSNDYWKYWNVIKNMFDSYDKKYFQSWYKDFLHFFDLFYQIEGLYYDYFEIVSEKSRDIAKKSFDKESMIEQEYKRLLSSKNFTYSLLDDFKTNREKEIVIISKSLEFLDLSLREKLSENLITDKTKFFKYLEYFEGIRSDIVFDIDWIVLFMKEFYFEIYKKIEWFFYLVWYKNYKTLWNNFYSNESEEICCVCWELFIKNKETDKTCSEDCSKKNKNMLKQVLRNKEKNDKIYKNRNW